jgi:hypothetical protein
MAMVSLAPASVEQPSESPIELVRRTVQRELAPGNGGAKLIFEDRKETPHGSQTKLVVETRDGTVGMTIAMNGKPLTPEQRQAALQKAAQVRRERAEVKERLKLGRLKLSELLERADKDETVGKMKVVSVLESLPGLGKVKARRLMETVGISESRRLQGLGAKQRVELLKETDR